MNCKPGDMAIRISAPEGAWIPVGSIVEVCLFVGGAFLTNKRFGRNLNDVWEVEFRGSRNNPATGGFWSLSDSELRPIRDQPGEDEMLRIAGLPNKQPEAA